MRFVSHSSLALIACFLATGASILVAQESSQQHHHGHRDGSRYAASLENPARDAWQKPDEVVRALAVKPGEVVADIGAGTGYFSRRFAAAGARVLAVDVDEAILQQHWSGGEKGVTKVLASTDDPKLPSAAVDTVFFCNVVHHIENRADYYAKVKTGLKPEGRVVVLDFFKRPLPVGPGPAMKIAREAMIAEWEAAGFRLTNEETFLPHQYFLEFRPK